jgi:hypothetical protein
MKKLLSNKYAKILSLARTTVQEIYTPTACDLITAGDLKFAPNE